MLPATIAAFCRCQAARTCCSAGVMTRRVPAEARHPWRCEAAVARPPPRPRSRSSWQGSGGRRTRRGPVLACRSPGAGRGRGAAAPTRRAAPGRRPGDVDALGAADLGQLPFLGPDAVTSSGYAYALSKRANHLRVQGAAVTWSDRGARVNSISPGIILTPLAKDKMSGPGAAGYQAMIAGSAAGRVGTTDEIATAAKFMLEAGFLTGADVLIDGGVIAALRAGRIALG